MTFTDTLFLKYLNILLQLHVTPGATYSIFTHASLPIPSWILCLYPYTLYLLHDLSICHVWWCDDKTLAPWTPGPFDIKLKEAMCACRTVSGSMQSNIVVLVCCAVELYWTRLYWLYWILTTVFVYCCLPTAYCLLVTHPMTQCFQERFCRNGL